MDELVFRLPPSAREDLATGMANKLQITGDLLDLVRLKLLTAFFPKDKVLEAAKTAFDNYVRPLDIPILDEATEKAVDDAAEQIFLLMVGLTWDAINNGVKS